MRPHVAKILSLSSLQVGLRTGTRVSGFTHYKHIKHIYDCCLADLSLRFKQKRYVFRMCFFMLFDFCHEWIFHLSDNTLEETTTRPSRDISVCCVCSLLTFYSFTFHKTTTSELPSTTGFYSSHSTLNQDLTEEFPTAIMAENSPTQHPSVHDSVLGSVPDSLPDSLPDSVLDSVPDSVPDSIPDSVSESVPDSLPDSVPDSVPNTPHPDSTQRPVTTETLSNQHSVTTEKSSTEQPSKPGQIVTHQPPLMEQTDHIASSSPNFDWLSEMYESFCATTSVCSYSYILAVIMNSLCIVIIFNLF